MICAFNEDFHSLVEEGRFSKELFDAVCGIEINIPPLRDRRLDIELLVAHFLKSQEVTGIGETQTKKISELATNDQNVVVPVKDVPFVQR